jgi:hypothetical protein
MCVETGTFMRASPAEQPPQEFGIEFIIATDGHIGTIAMAVAPVSHEGSSQASEAVDIEDDDAIRAVGWTRSGWRWGLRVAF